MRRSLSELTCGKRVLKGFCYTGGFTLAALKGGALHVDSVDSSLSALELCKENVALNGYSTQTNGFYHADMFDFLGQKGGDYDLIILDPPAFAKKKRDIPAACNGYRTLFGQALQKLGPNALLIASSCSYYISEELFENCLRDAALETKRAIRLIGRHRQALDHPINLFHPESGYLKSLVAYIITS
jgi:23S rRNA (cytosine1962-C5)-methyltransferase